MLKYIDKHGNVSRRKRHNTPKERTEQIQDEALTIAGIPTETETNLELEKKQLLAKIVDINHKIEARCFFGSVAEQAEQLAFLIEKHPEYANLDKKESLGNEDLKHLKDALDKIEDETDEERRELSSAVDDVYWGIRRMIDVDDYSIKDEMDIKIAEAFPGFLMATSRNSLWDAPIPHLKLILKVVKAASEDITKNGYDRFLPDGYVKEEDREGGDVKAGEILAKEARRARSDARDAFKEMMGGDELSWRIPEQGFPAFVKEHNKHHKGAKVTAGQVRSSEWNWRDKPKAEVEKIKLGFEEMTAVLKARPDWINDFVWYLCAEDSTLHFEVRNNFNARLLERKLVPATPLQPDEYEMFIDEINAAIDDVYERILDQRGVDKEEII